MVKKPMKQSNPSLMWPAPKRGKARALTKRPARKVKPMKFLKVPYVRHGTPTTRHHHERERWGRSIQLFMSMKYQSLIRLLRQDRVLPDWTKKPCPHCGHGALTKLAFIKSRKMWAHRCRVKACQRFVQPADFHPIFVAGAGNSKTSLQKQASILLCAVASVPQHCISKILDVDDKIVSRVYTNVDMARARFVMAHEKNIQYGGGPDWVDVEADEVDLGKAVVDNNKVKWEQWCGIVQRGASKTLRLVQLQPPLTKTRSPGPGPIRKKDWKPIAEKLLAGRHIVLHTDGARAYKLKLDKVVHCNVVHKKKKVKVGNKAAC